MAPLVKLADLASALQVTHGEMVALVGGGGKTTTLFALGEQLDGTSILTTTTKMGADQTGPVPVLIDPSDDEVRLSLLETDSVLVWQDADERRAIGVAPGRCDRWFEAVADNVIVEADGSRKRPFKAPIEYEPVVPQATTLLLACVGARAFGVPIVECCHRPARVADLAQCAVDDELTPERAARVLLSPHGSQKGRPAGARYAVLVHRVGADDAPLVNELASILATADTEMIAVERLA